MFAKKTLAAALLTLAVFGTAAPVPAAADESRVAPAQLVASHPDRWRDDDGRRHGGWNHGWHRTLSAHDIRRILRRHGYREVRFLDRRGAIYQARVVDWRGRHQGLVISARNGAILAQYRL